MKSQILLSLLLTGVVSNASASLIGDTVHIAENFPQIGTEYDAADVVVGNGIELTWPFVMDFNISANAIDIFVRQVTFGDIEDYEFVGPVISNLNDSSGNPLIGFTNFSTDSTFSSSNIVFGADFIGFNFDAVQFGNNSIHVDLDFGQTSVPEPASWGLVVAGLIGIGLSRRYRPRLKSSTI